MSVSKDKGFAAVLAKSLDSDALPICEAMMLVDNFDRCNSVFLAVGPGFLNYSTTSDVAMRQVMKGAATVGDLKTLMAEAGIDSCGHSIPYLCAAFVQARIWIKCLRAKLLLSIRSAKI